MEPGAVFRDYVSSETERGSPTPRCCCWFDLEKVVGVVVQNCRISSIDFNKNSSYMVTASDDDSIRLYDVATATWVDIFPNFNLVGWCWMSMYNNSLFFFCCWLWYVIRCLKTINSKKYGVDLVCFTSHPTTVIYSSRNGWDGKPASERAFFLPPQYYFYYVWLHNNPSLPLLVWLDSLRLLSLHDNKYLRYFKGHHDRFSFIPYFHSSSLTGLN